VKLNWELKSANQEVTRGVASRKKVQKNKGAK